MTYEIWYSIGLAVFVIFVLTRTTGFLGLWSVMKRGGSFGAPDRTKVRDLRSALVFAFAHIPEGVRGAVNLCSMIFFVSTVWPIIPVVMVYVNLKRRSL